MGKSDVCGALSLTAVFVVTVTSAAGVWCRLNAGPPSTLCDAPPALYEPAVLCCCDLLRYERLWNCLRARVWRNTVCRHSALTERRWCDSVNAALGSSSISSFIMKKITATFLFLKDRECSNTQEFTLTYKRLCKLVVLPEPIRAMTCVMSSRRRN